jgi:hypothetical protein
MASVRISPGRLTALWTVLRALEKIDGRGPVADVRRVASRTSLRSGGLPIADGIALAVEGRFTTRSGDELEIAPLGEELRLPDCRRVIS